MAKTIEPISSFKRAAELVSQVRESRAPIYITQNGKAAAVLVDVESYEEQQQAFALLKMCLDGGQSSACAGRAAAQQLIFELNNPTQNGSCPAG